MTEARYPIPAAQHRTEEEIRRSRFITTLAHAPTVEEARALIAQVSREFGDASHNCWAYVVGPPGSTSQVAKKPDPLPAMGEAMRAQLLSSFSSSQGNLTLTRPNCRGSLMLVTIPTTCLLYTSPSPRDRTRSRMPSSA